ncbi:MAG: hypothetical protein ABJF23_14195 [Bryobacteraceae bacterium]
MTAPPAVAARKPAADMSKVLQTTWGKLVIPSLSDFFFLAVTLWMFASGQGWNQLLMDGDTGWHIRTGEYILDHHAVPLTDLFSFSKAGAPWFAWEWLADVIYGALFRSLGLKGVVLLSGLMISTIATIILRHMLWRKANLFLSLAITLFCAAAASIHYHARPHLFTLLLLVITLWMLDRDRQNPSWHVWLLIPLTALWTNLHGGFLLMIAITGLLAVGTMVETLWFERRQWSSALRYPVLLAGCSLATLVNPYGTGLHRHVIDYLGSNWIKDMVEEFHSPNFRSESMLYFEILLFLGLAVAVCFVRRRKIVEPLWLLYFAHTALTSVRHVTIFVFLAGPIIAVELSGWWLEWSKGRSPKSLPGILNQLAAEMGVGFRWASVWPAVLAAGLICIDRPIVWPTDFSGDRFPAKIVNANREQIASARVLTSDQWGDYLIFQLYPAVKVFMDGRSDFYGEELGKEYLAMLQGRYDWNSLLSKYRFSMVLAPVSWPLCSLLKQTKEWKVITDDGNAILFLRKTDPN